MMNKKFIRVLCIFLAILMLGSVMIAALQAFATDTKVEESTSIVENATCEKACNRACDKGSCGSCGQGCHMRGKG